MKSTVALRGLRERGRREESGLVESLVVGENTSADDRAATGGCAAAVGGGGGDDDGALPVLRGTLNTRANKVALAQEN